MKKLLMTCALLLPCSAMAQQPIEYNLKLTTQEIEVISDGLGTQPFNKVVPIVNKMRAQVLEQQAAANKPVTPPPAPETKPEDKKE